MSQYQAVGFDETEDAAPRFLSKKHKRSNRESQTVEPGARTTSKLGQQMWRDDDTNQMYLINGESGAQLKVDLAGGHKKKFYNNVTGSSNFIMRQQKAQQMGDKLCMAEVPRATMHKYEMLPLILAQVHQTNHMPTKTQTEYFQLKQQQAARFKQRAKRPSLLEKMEPSSPAEATSLLNTASAQTTKESQSRVFIKRRSSIESGPFATNATPQINSLAQSSIMEHKRSTTQVAPQKQQQSSHKSSGSRPQLANDKSLEAVLIHETIQEADFVSSKSRPAAGKVRDNAAGGPGTAQFISKGITPRKLVPGYMLFARHQQQHGKTVSGASQLSSSESLRSLVVTPGPQNSGSQMFNGNERSSLDIAKPVDGVGWSRNKQVLDRLNKDSHLSTFTIESKQKTQSKRSAKLIEPEIAYGQTSQSNGRRILNTKATNHLCLDASVQDPPTEQLGSSLFGVSRIMLKGQAGTTQTSRGGFGSVSSFAQSQEITVGGGQTHGSHRRNIRTKTFSTLKSEKQSTRLMPQFQQIKKSDLRGKKVTGFLRQSQQENLHEMEKQLMIEGETGRPVARDPSELGSPRSPGSRTGSISIAHHPATESSTMRQKPAMFSHLISQGEVTDKNPIKHENLQEYTGMVGSASPQNELTSPFRPRKSPGKNALVTQRKDSKGSIEQFARSSMESTDNSPLFIVNRRSQDLLIGQPGGGSSMEGSKLSYYQNSVFARTKNMVSEEEIENFEHKFPFRSGVRLDPASINEQRVHLNVRRPAEFGGGLQAKMVFDQAYKEQIEFSKKAATSPKRLEVNNSVERSQEGDDPESLQKRGSSTAVGKVRTKGLFRADEAMRKVIKHSADFQKGDFKLLVDQNENLQRYFERKAEVESKKLKSKRMQKVIMDKEVKLTMAKNERQFQRQNMASLRSTFLKDKKQP